MYGDVIDNYQDQIDVKFHINEDLLDEAIAFQNTHKQANRIKCATLGWKAIEKLMILKTAGVIDEQD